MTTHTEKIICLQILMTEYYCSESFRAIYLFSDLYKYVLTESYMALHDLWTNTKKYCTLNDTKTYCT